MTTKVFLDSEFTGLHQNSTLISLALIDENSNSFYAEFNDYDHNQVDDWIFKNVINNLLFKEDCLFKDEESNSINLRNTTEVILNELREWLSNYDQIEVWSDCLSYDWVLFNNLFGNAFLIPDNIYYIPFDICTLFKIKGIDPDINREEFSNNTDGKHRKHNALYDALVIKNCYEKAIKL